LRLISGIDSNIQWFSSNLLRCIENYSDIKYVEILLIAISRNK
jgi:hypothetical protein